MKSMIYKTLFAFTLLAVLFGCKKNESLDHLKVTAVQNLYSPDNNKTIALQPAGTELFEWAPALAEDGGLVMYEVAFDKVGGNFSNPIYLLSSDNNGTNTSANISDKVLNKVAAQAGIGSSETGQIIWTVMSSKGINQVKCATSYTMTVTRLAGFADIPAQVFITGDASEGGTDLSKALPMKSTAAGEFEIYTQLTAGKSYNFVDKTSGTPRTFYVSGGILKEGGSSTADNTAVYRINLDFNAGSAVFTEMKKLELFFDPNNVFLFELPYSGSGTFTATNQPITFKQESWGRDERYKFRMTVNTGGGAADTYEWWGSVNADNSRPDSSTPLSFYYIVPVTSDQWNNSFKFRTEIDSSYSDVIVYFQPDKPYTHEVIKISNQ